jgi:alcohol dehydrogenase class IV
MRYNLPTRVPEFAEIGRILGVATGAELPEQQAQSAIVRIETILQTLGAPLDLRTLGLAPSDFDFVAKQAMLATRLTANNPRELTTDSVVSILQRGYDGDRSWWQL